MRMSGARIVLECLAEQGVDTVFGYPGGAILNVYDELYRWQGRIRHVLTAHEQAAAHAADGYARSTGRPGVVFATSGPGATNIVTGLAAAHMDSSPVVAITCNVASHLIGCDSFQEVSITGITMPITKHNFLVREVEALASTIRQAFAIATTGRPGPVLVDIPKDLTLAEAEWAPPGERDGASSILASRLRSPADQEIEEAAELLSRAERPLVIAGGGVISSGASSELEELARLTLAPVALTFMGHGGLPSRHPQCTGMIGMHGTRASNRAAGRADLVLAAGCRFSDRVLCDASKFASGAKVIHLDIDPAEIGKNLWCGLGLVGDLKPTLARICARLRARGGGGAEGGGRAAWAAEVAAWKAEEAEAVSRIARPAGAIAPRLVMEEIRARAGAEAIVTTEVGQHQMWTAQYYPFERPRSFISSGGLGAMGFGTGAAIGAQAAHPGRRVVHIAGDGSFRMNCAELGTIAAYGLPIVIVVMNNGVLGMVRQWQTMFYGSRHSETSLDRPPDFVKLAEAFGVRGYRAPDAASLGAALDAAFGGEGPALVDLAIDPDEQVLPIVPPGKAIAEQIVG
ncbi:MAG TPA: biosynthetic-type acetolactate synthase large subunit [Spirochaetales bacterium]|nr:biosynthetic-type acetolactate synthase large subunit [Spirochaetales bacterium]HRY55311.1 biosynthetic-type acetolactate synthase large subunit [Spirochaetia bacterium]HRZ64334.1 biosynthetic-type acetolactate synthase large subunit [Spirochaetia bacterium]